MTALPSRAAVRLADIEQAARDADALHDSCTDAIKTLMRRANNPDLPAEERAQAAEKATATRVTLMSRADRRQSLTRLLQNVSRWIAQLPRGTTLALAERPTLDANTTDDLEGSLRSVRAQIDEVRTQLRRTESAPPTRDDLISQARDAVAGLKPPQVVNGLPAANTSALQLVAWLFPHQLLARIEESITATASPDGVSLADRPALLDEMRDQWLDLQFIEEEIVQQLHAHQRDVDRRPNADPRAVLGVVIEQKETAAKAA